MKRVLILTLIMSLCLTTLVFAGTGKIDVDVQETQDSAVISNEGGGYLIDEMIAAGYGSYTLYQALLLLAEDADGTLSQSFINTVANAPAASEVFLATLDNYASISGGVVIAADGTVHYTDIRGADYNGQTGYDTYSTDSEAGVGRELFTYATSPNYYIDASSTTDSYGGGIVTWTTQYKAFAIGWSSPIVLDLNGDGKLEASSGTWLPHNGFIEGSKVAMFDMNADGFQDIVEWVGVNDGLLLMPGETINDLDGSKLFGNTDGYKHGYEKLSQYDLNNDSLLTGDELAGMKVWIDENGDAIATSGEVKTLEKLGITELSTGHNNYSSSFVQDGQRKYTWDWWPTYMDVQKVAVPVENK